MNQKIGQDIQLATQYLLNNELVAIPTETVYGLAGNALNENVVSNIFLAKNRPKFNPLILHIKNIQEIDKYCIEVPPLAYKLANHFMPGPLTLLLKKSDLVHDILVAGSKKVAIRIPNHPLTLTLLNQLPFPLAAPSANPFGYVSPTSAKHVYDNLKDKVSYILDGGECSVGVESTIIELDENENIIIHRNGGISKEAIEDFTQQKCISVFNSVKIETPGQLKSHYAPNTPLFRGSLENYTNEIKDNKVAFIGFKKTEPVEKNIDYYFLSENENLAEAAVNLFKTLRILDQKKYDLIIAEIFPNEGLGTAINDRLDRAQFIHK
jgi:L-threonylcarbamoyladenylate synthase